MFPELIEAIPSLSSNVPSIVNRCPAPDSMWSVANVIVGFCTDSITYVTGVIQQCVKMPQSETTNAV